MSDTQFGWLIVPQLLILMMIIGGWIRSRVKHWSSKLRYDCTAHVHGMQVQLETIQSGQQRLLDRIDRLKQQS